MLKRLYHFSDKEFSEIDPKFFGGNHYTKNDSQYKCPRFFCYDTSNPQEHLLSGCEYKYIIEIDSKNIYNLIKDKEGLKEKFSGDIEKLLKYLAKHYTGAVYDVGFNCYIIFKTIKPVTVFKRVYQQGGKKHERIS